MANKQVIVWLGRYQASLRREQTLAEEVAELRGDAARCTASLNGLPGTGVDTARLPRAVERIAAMQAELAEQIETGIALRAEIRRAIDTLPRATAQEVLRRHYLLGQTFEAAADSMGIGVRRVYQLHKQAVDTLAALDEVAAGCVDAAG